MLLQPEQNKTQPEKEQTAILTFPQSVEVEEIRAAKKLRELIPYGKYTKFGNGTTQAHFQGNDQDGNALKLILIDNNESLSIFSFGLSEYSNTRISFSHNQITEGSRGMIRPAHFDRETSLAAVKLLLYYAEKFSNKNWYTEPFPAVAE